MSSVERVRPVLTGALSGLGLLTEDVTVTPAGKRSVLRVAVDRDLDALALEDGSTPVSPLSLDEVAEATRAVASALDDSDVMGERPYVLEVTSPGVDRPLTLPRHFRRNVGRRMEVTLRDGRRETGRLRSADGDTLSLTAPAGGGDAERELALADVVRAQVQVEFARGPEPAMAQEED